MDALKIEEIKITPGENSATHQYYSHYLQFKGQHMGCQSKQIVQHLTNP